MDLYRDRLRALPAFLPDFLQFMVMDTGPEDIEMGTWTSSEAQKERGGELGRTCAPNFC